MCKISIEDDFQGHSQPPVKMKSLISGLIMLFETIYLLMRFHQMRIQHLSYFFELRTELTEKIIQKQEFVLGNIAR